MKKVVYLGLALILGLTLSACTTDTVDPLECETGQHEDNGVCVDDTVVVVDETAPVLSGITDVTIEVGDSFDKMSGVSANDETDGDLTEDIVVTGAVVTTTAGEYTLTYTVEDAAGNSVSDSRVVTVEVAEMVYTPDWAGYGFTVVADEDSETISYEGITATFWTVNAQLPLSSFDGTKDAAVFTFTGTAGHTYLFKFEGDGGNVELSVVATGELQTHVIPLDGLDEAGRNQFNKIVFFCTTVDAVGTIDLVSYELAMLSELPDTFAPVITGAADAIVALNGTFDDMAGISAMDDTDGDLTSSVVVSGTVDPSVAADYVLTYTVSDAAGNEAMVERTVKVVATDWVGYGMDVMVVLDNESLTYADVAVGSNWWDTNAQQLLSNFDGTKDGMLFTFTGELGHTYLFKVEGNSNYEMAVVGTGEEQVFLLSLAGMSEADRASLNKLIIFVQTVGASGSVELAPWEAVVIADLGDVIAPSIMGADNAIVMVDGTFDNMAGVSASDIEDGDLTGSITVSGTVDLTTVGSYELVYMVEDAAGNKGVAIRTVVVSATAWIGYGFDVAVDGENETITYTAITGNWWDNNAQQPIEDFDGTNESIVFTFTGTAGHTYLFKVEGDANLEESVVATGSEQVFELSLSSLTEAQRDSLSLMIVFAEVAATDGTLTIAPWAYGEAVVQEWVGYNAHTAVDGGDGSVVVTYTTITGNWWDNNTQYPMSDFDETKGSVIVTFTGEVGQSYLFKIESLDGSFAEAGAVATGSEETVEIDLTGMTSEQRAAINNYVIFVNELDVAGTVTVNGFAYGADAPLEDPVWIAYGTMVATENPTNTVINYGGAFAWGNNAQLELRDFDGTNTSIFITFTGTAGSTYKWKIENADSSVFVELDVTATGSLQEVEIDLSGLTEAQRDGLVKLVFFALTGDGANIIDGWDYVTGN